MKILTTILAAASLAGAWTNVHAQSTDLEISGDVSYQTLDNRSSVRISVDRITNRSSNRVSGTVHIKLFATVAPNVISQGYTLADINLAQYDTSSVTPGQLEPGHYYSDIAITTDFFEPPDGTYYVHLFVAEYPNLNTVLDHVTFSNLLTVGSGNPSPPAPTDDHGDTFDNASPMGVNGSLGGRLEVNGDRDMFRIDVPGDGNIDLYSTGAADTVGTLYDAAGAQVAFNDDASGTNFGLAARVSPGTYYLQVSGYNDARTGDYTVVSSFIADPVDPPITESGGGGGSVGLLMLLGMLLMSRRRR